MNRFRILPYKMNSLSSKALSKHFNVKRIYPNRAFKPSPGDVVLNWGCNDAPVLDRDDINFTVINKPHAVDNASNKIATLRLLKQNNVPHVKFHLSRDSAENAIDEGRMIYCRTLTRGREGRGIVLAKSKEDLVDARLYTEHFKNNHEFRIHVFMGDVIDMVEKKKMSQDRIDDFARRGIEVVVNEESEFIRNLKKGYSFCRNDIDIPDHVKQTAIDAVSALGLDFGGVDIAYDDETDEAKVLEINTACGQKKATTTHLRYCRAITEKVLGQEFSVDEYNRRYNCNAETYIR